MTIENAGGVERRTAERRREDRRQRNDTIDGLSNRELLIRIADYNEKQFTSAFSLIAMQAEKEQAFRDVVLVLAQQTDEVLQKVNRLLDLLEPPMTTLENFEPKEQGDDR